jgi:hypothetical protein
MSHRVVLLVLPLVVACTTTPVPGTNIGALREPDPSPVIPTDTTSLDWEAAIEEALTLGGLASLTAAWAGHVAALELGTGDCPTMWVGPLPEDFVDLDIDDEVPGLSWAGSCFAPSSATNYEGWAHWSSTLVPEGVATLGTRSLTSQAVISNANGDPLFSFDGSAADELDASTGQYATVVDGELSGALVGLGSGIRTGGELGATWGGGFLSFSGSLTALDGFGPADFRDPATSPELEFADFTPGMPRFTSVVFDLEVTPDCPTEPVGYLGLRGNEGFWFDVYFLPKYDPIEEPSAAGAFPFEEIDNVACDGVGTLFARNVSLRDIDEADASWSRELTPDLAGAIAALPTPGLDAYVYTLRDLPLE